MQLQQSIQRLEAERDHYRKEYINCRNEQRRLSDKDNVRIESKKLYVQKIIIYHFVNKLQADLWTQICELRRELGDKEQALSKAQRAKEELYHQKEDLEARLQTYKNQQRQTCTPCRSCSLCKPARTCTCVSDPPISTGDLSATKVLEVTYNS